MTERADADLLARLDRERRALGVASDTGDVVREWAADRSQCRIVIADPGADDVDALIRRERDAASAGGYELEWKAYGHDLPVDLPERLIAFGFEADDSEDVLALRLDEAVAAALEAPSWSIRIVTDESGLDDYAAVATQIGRRDVDRERRALALALASEPDRQSVHVAYVDGSPVACGRVHYRPGGPYAELAGGRTMTTHRRRGLFSALVASRLDEARDRGRTHAFVDALPTSAPTLRRLGFRLVTTTRPFVHEPGS